MFMENTQSIQDYLSQIQEHRETTVKLLLSPRLSAQLTDSAVRNLLVTSLPMVQGIKQQIIHSRGTGSIVRAKLLYRDGLRMAEFALEGKGTLTPREHAALQYAQSIAEHALSAANEKDRCEAIVRWICRNLHYTHTAPGHKGYDLLVSASGALLYRQANCQGFADTLYLLCRLCGLKVRYCCGMGERRLHLWNEVCISGEWHTLDASREARNTPSLRTD